MDTQKLKVLMKAYLDADNKYKEYMKDAEPLKIERDEAKDAVMQFFEESGMEQTINMNTEEGVVQYRKTKSYGGITKKLLVESLEDYIVQKRLQVDVKELISHIWAKREVNEKWDLSRKMETDE
jgi:hypothetical protein